MQSEIKAQEPITSATLQKWTDILEQYKAAKASLDNRVVKSEQWWKLRNAEQAEEEGVAKKGKFAAESAWLHNIITNKHADAMAGYPAPTFLPREEDDEEEATALSDVVPIILKRDRFMMTWSKAMWSKLKAGTAVYKVTWDAEKDGGLGDIRVEPAKILQLFWEPGVDDIQQSRYFFHVAAEDIETLREEYPDKEIKAGETFTPVQYRTEDNPHTDELTVIDVYYHRHGRLHYCKYVNNTVLYSTENDPAMADRGLYDHGKYPFVFDPLWPVEESPCGYGFVDIFRNPQIAIDLLDTAMIKNAMAGATPRFFAKANADINEEEMLDLTNPIVHTKTSLGEDSIRHIEYQPLEGNYISIRDALVNQIRETSGNTETATGSTASGVTAASAIAALQEASGKGSKDFIAMSYEAFEEICLLVVELIRQFYSQPRRFRITAEDGKSRYTTFDAEPMQPRPTMMLGDRQLYRTPVYDVDIKAQRETAYTTIATNEMALQFYQLGFFDPANVDRTLMTMEMMDFRDKETIMQHVAQMGTMADKFNLLVNYAASLARKYGDELALQQIAGMIGMPAPTMGGTPDVESAAGGYGAEGNEHPIVERARAESQAASQPGGAI